MRPVLASRLRDASVDCQQWVSARQTDAGALDTGPGERHHDHVTFDGDQARFERALEMVMRYAMFPSSWLLATVCSDDGRLAPGVTVVQRVFMGPVGVESGVRVMDVFDEVEARSGSAQTDDRRRAGFSCGTLLGHPERGVERFTLTLHEGRITFSLESRSELATWYARLGPPIARFFQHRAVAAAMRYVEQHSR